MAYVLRKQRIAAGLTAAELARSVGMSGSKISRFETCESGIYLDDLEKLIDFYQLSKQRRVELLDIARNAEQRGWLRTRNGVLPTDWQAWVDFEDEASALRSFEPLIIPGLLQTPEYARAIMCALSDSLPGEKIDRLAASRRIRQHILTRQNPVELHAIVDECALERRFANADRNRQLRHLLDEGRKQNVTLQVLPRGGSLHAGLAGAFTILEYDGEPSLVGLEQLGSSLYLDEEEQIDLYVDAWARLRKTALSPGDSADLVRQLLVYTEEEA